MKKCVTLTLGETTIKKEPDYDADTSYLGEYGNKLKPGCYIRSHKKFYEDITDDDDIPNYYDRNEFNFFYPSDQGVEIGSEDYRKYAMQNYELIEGLNNQEWYYIGIVVKTEIIAMIQNLTDKTKYTEISDTIISSLYGIEYGISNNEYTDESYIKETIKDLLSEQKDQLLKMGFSDKEIEQSFKGAKEVDL
jgi:hypothetical protein